MVKSLSNPSSSNPSSRLFMLSFSTRMLSGVSRSNGVVNHIFSVCEYRYSMPIFSPVEKIE